MTFEYKLKIEEQVPLITSSSKVNDLLSDNTREEYFTGELKYQTYGYICRKGEPYFMKR